MAECDLNMVAVTPIRKGNAKPSLNVSVASSGSGKKRARPKLTPNRRQSKKTKPCLDVVVAPVDLPPVQPTAVKALAPYSHGDATAVMHETEDEYEVEEILDYNPNKGGESYLVKWKGWGEEFNSWVLKEDLHCPDLLKNFSEKTAVISGITLQAPDMRRYLENLLKVYKPKEENVESLVSRHIGDLDNLLSGVLSRSGLEHLLKNAFAAHMKCQELEQQISNQLLLREIDKRRKEHQERLKQWEAAINVVATKYRPALKVENYIDLEDPPIGFVYSEACKAGEGVIVPEDPIVGCECKDCNGNKHCCGHMSGSMPAYNSWGKLKVPLGVPIYECNNRCKCGPECHNRVVQKGSKYKLCIFRTANGTGWGIKSLENIKKDSFVTEYVGEIITSEEAERRGEKYDAEGRTYLFDLDYNDSDSCPYTVDAAFYGNAAHFINHSCDPNLAVFGVWVNCLDPNMPKLALFAKRDIKRGEEITFDYMSEASKTNGQLKNEDSTSRLVEDEQASNGGPAVLTVGGKVGRKNPDASDKMECKCGSPNCRKFLFS